MPDSVKIGLIRHGSFGRQDAGLTINLPETATRAPPGIFRTDFNRVRRIPRKCRDFQIECYDGILGRFMGDRGTTTW